MEYLWLVAGFVLLIVGADVFVEGSSAIARLFKIPSIIIGLTVVAFGTSMPEASVSINAALVGENSIAVSNAIGSNFFNLLVVLGASALICPVRTGDVTVKKEIPLSIVITVILGFLLCLGITPVVEAAETSGFFARLPSASFTLGRVGGIVLLAILAFYVVRQILGALKARDKDGGDVECEGSNLAPGMAVEMVILGMVGIIMGGNYVVESAKTIAQNFGMCQTFIGLTVVAFGTSLPELVTSMVAAKKGESDLALGNVIGSNIFNIVFILGFSSVISPMTVNVLTIYDIIVLIGVSAVVWLFCKSKKQVSRLEGGIMLAMYAAYFVYILLR